MRSISVHVYHRQDLCPNAQRVLRPVDKRLHQVGWPPGLSRRQGGTWSRGALDRGPWTVDRGPWTPCAFPALSIMFCVGTANMIGGGVMVSGGWMVHRPGGVQLIEKTVERRRGRRKAIQMN